MSDQCQGTVHCKPEDLQEALSIHTRKITDSCRDKDCIEDLRVYLSRSSQAVLDTAAGAKVRSAELLYTYIDVEPVAFDRNHYCIDVTFYYRILADAVIGNARPASLYGLAVFSKRAVLCGEESRAHIFTSDTRIGSPDGLSRYSANLPTAVVEVTDTNSQNTKPTHIQSKLTGAMCEECIGFAPAALIHRSAYRGSVTWQTCSMRKRKHALCGSSFVGNSKSRTKRKIETVRSDIISAGVHFERCTPAFFALCEKFHLLLFCEIY